jgi:tRNA U34 5-methylaminomethyl-2-thiouridine-forming methyltransferase MnmC
MQRRIVETGDGSKTIHIEDWNENYHSHHGAVQEALHVFILKVRENLGERKAISILEMGFGTGLNAYLTLRLATELGIEVNYVGLEAFPVESDELNVLNYASLWEEGSMYYQKMHSFAWGECHPINSNFILTKIEMKFEDWSPLENTFDFIYFDAFGPRVQPELWTIPIFDKMYHSAKEGGVFLTYCAKGQVRRELAEVGWGMKRLPGPPGKREMLLGIK